ncbi:MAG: peptide-methionine (S)-S-oxide reductase [bacterium TMED264]|nr:MAG: peptide-methionine (S)-S-oxide reductase [bacterium TMED264]
MVQIKLFVKSLKLKSTYLIFCLHYIIMAQTETATLGGGCFWCVEAVYQRVKGIESVKPGYAGGHVKNPSYKEICTGNTGHAEVAQINFNKNIITYEQILNVFWQSHDPTTLNRQGNDVGTQYRSVIFYHNNEQKEIAEKSKEYADNSDYWKNPIVTEITMLNNYSNAEDYHDNYYDNNPNQPYCLFVIRPKLNKLQKDGVID